MSILRSLNTGVAGLRSHGEALGVVADNIANVNTVGFKTSRAIFQDVLGRSAGGSKQLPMAGAGSRMSYVEQLFHQGALLTTDSPTDLAVSGGGFFAVRGNVGGIDGQFYTRAGQFHMDTTGRLVNPDGLALQGYAADPTGQLGSTISDLVVDSGTLQPFASTAADIAANLDSNEVVPAAWDALNPDGTSNFSTAMTVYDSLGNSHEITVYFRKSAANAWEWHAMVDGGELTGGTPGVPTEGAAGTLTFTTDGALDTEAAGASSWDFIGATAGQAIAFDFGTSITTDGGLGTDGTTQYASPSSTTALAQDGYGAGQVQGIAIGQDGTVTGVYSNGQQRTIGQVVLAEFANDVGLERLGQGLWRESQDSGAALIGAAGSGARGAVVQGALEQSNVDLGQQFVDLIAYQRGFQANSKTIQTADEMYGEIVNLRR